MQHTPANEFALLTKNYSAPQTDGTPITPGVSNTMGSWVDLFGATLTDDTYGVYLKANDGQVSGTARPILLDLGYDPSGGTSYQVLIPQLAFSGPASSGHSNWLASGPTFFPVFIPAGSRVAARAQTKTSSNPFFQKALLLQKPSHPELLRCGTRVEAVGVDAGNSRGTVYTPGHPTVGAWTQLGSTTIEGFYVVPAYSIDNSNLANNDGWMDLAVGDATDKRLLVSQQRIGHGSDEVSSQHPYPESALYHHLPAGSNLYIRGLDSGGTPNTGQNAVAYVVGGT